MTNAEKLAAYVTKNGPESLLVHTVPGTRFWLVCQKRDQENWRIVLMDPSKTTHRLVSDRISEVRYLSLWKELVTLELGNRIRHAVQKLRKQVDHHRSSTS